MAVQGITFTIGIEMLLAADIRIAASDTRFGQLEIARTVLANPVIESYRVEVEG